ncbi:hypothetical protein EZI54_22860 [Marinobacter halodurans]|uniref:Sulfatase-modifying factor enzyme-like domain-containing protein n=1 Tax=Marinobacter halodurans TaxID=2528979 RepID=A0ABY1ZHI1_9GAMM|nr:SUMF1/EgtB/PvdO family nonheme iron enzyme [Marinobacter halodurans]TBW46943.1 hypothetical protein EZI54_22860 [Marinobacter halodurans]
MRRLSALALAFLAGCSSSSITSKTLSDSEIEAIKSRVEARYPDLPSGKQQAVTELVVRALDNMVPIEGGSFMMGDFKVPCEPGSDQLCRNDFYKDNDYIHKVTLDDYSLSKYETTIADFDLFRELQGKEPYEKEIREREGREYLFEPDKPAWTKNWQEPKDYCLWVGELASRPVDLPTEAQWEFAARNRGKEVRYATDNGKIEFGRNHQKKRGRESQAVGSFPPNPLGIYDLMGNTSEWIRDKYSETYYHQSPEINPMGPPDGQGHVVRGGSYLTTPDLDITVTRGSNNKLGFYSNLYGFRCASSL